jgi:hypothetical protein
VTKIDTMLLQRKATTEEAMRIFDELEPVTLELTTGRWKGFEIDTCHRMNGLLEPSGWYGKLFEDPEKVHPLLFYTKNRTALYSVNPKLVPFNMKLPQSKILGSLMNLLKPVLQTREPKARIRMVEYRGKVTVAIVYDKKNVNDYFAKINDHTMLGAMHVKGALQPFVFVLERDHTTYKLNF